MSQAQEGALHLTRSRIHTAFPTSPSNPNNWTRRKQWTVITTVSVSGFISTCASSIAVPTVHAIGEEFGEKNEKVAVLITSLYVLGLGTGPFIFAPISELWGRQTAYLSSQALFIIFSAGCVAAQSLPALIVLRFFAGVCGSSGPSLGVATVADVFLPQFRGRPISLYAIGPLLGPTLGSMLGYWLLFGGWRWNFGFMTILAAINFLAMIFTMEETYAPVIQRKMLYDSVHAPASGKSSLHKLLASVKWMRAMVSRDEARDAFRKAFSRPPRLLLYNPVALIFSLYYSYIYALIYLFLVSIPILYGSQPYTRPSLHTYGWPQATLPLAYLSLGMGYCSAAFFAATFQDRIYKHLAARKARKEAGLEEKELSRDETQRGEPEFRLVLTQLGMCLLPIGLLIFGWTAFYETHWIAPAIGGFILSLGLMLAFNSIQNFLVDCFYPYSAAAMAGATFTRSVIGAVLPIFAGDMFVALGWGWGGTLLAGIALIAVPAPAIMFMYGPRLRERYQFKG